MHSLLRFAAFSALAAVSVANPVAWEPPQGPPASPPWGQPTRLAYSSSSPSRASTTTLAPTSSSTAPSTPSCQGYFEPLAAPYLDDLAQAAGKLWFGSATDQPGTAEDTNILYQTILNDTQIFGQITPANAMKFLLSEPGQNEFKYTEGDIDVAIAKDHGKYLRCHNLVWASQVSESVLNDNWTAAQLTTIMQNHINNVVSHWGGNCYSWDVVNEAIFNNGTFSPSICYDTIGPEYFFLAFQFAQATVDALPAGTPKPKLYYNDYGIEAPDNKSAAAEGLVKQLQARNIRIDGVGLESHFEVGGTPSLADQIAKKQAYIALGVEVAITELDVRFVQANATNATAFAEQAQNYYDTVASCVEVDGCVGITMWDFDDQYR